MKRLLVISFALPPTPGANPSRAWHIARHLPGLDWEAIVVTPRHPRRRVTVESAREHRDLAIPLRRVRDPSGASFWLQETGYRDLAAGWRKNALPANADQDLPGLYGRQGPTPEEAALDRVPRPPNIWRCIVASVRFDPDPRAGWIAPAIEAARAAAHLLQPDAIYSISPPLSAHCAASRIAGDLRIPWLADLRWPWTQSAYGPAGRIRGAAVLRRAMRAGPGGRIDLLPSFDAADFRTADAPAGPVRTDPFVLLHAGSTATAGRDPIPVLDAVRALIDRGVMRADAIRVRFLGANDPRLAPAIAARRLGSVVTREPAVPWEVSIQTQSESAALLMTLGPGDGGRIPDRLLEAFSVRRPLFAVGPAGTALRRLVTASGIGSACADADSLAEAIAARARVGSAELARRIDLAADVVEPYRAEALVRRIAGAF